ncbi:hypothetical protein TNCV_4525481 [Trichonephila clavipes]|nr:hypothetical protein TNCV_4525481 [Trichonephila clavipes]
MSKGMTTTYSYQDKLVKEKYLNKKKLIERDRRILKSIVSKKRTTAAKETSELNQHRNFPVSMITVRRHLHKQHIQCRAALVTDSNVKRRLQCHQTWLIDKWKKLI